MNSISFSFTSESSEEDRVRAMDAIRGWSDVAAVAMTKSDSKNPVVRRMGTVLVGAAEKAANVLAKLQEIPEIAGASLPAVRSLISPHEPESPRPT